MNWHLFVLSAVVYSIPILSAAPFWVLGFLFFFRYVRRWIDCFFFNKMNTVR